MTKSQQDLVEGFSPWNQAKPVSVVKFLGSYSIAETEHPASFAVPWFLLPAGPIYLLLPVAPVVSFLCPELLYQGRVSLPVLWDSSVCEWLALVLTKELAVCLTLLPYCWLNPPPSELTDFLQGVQAMLLFPGIYPHTHDDHPPRLATGWWLLYLKHTITGTYYWSVKWVAWFYQLHCNSVMNVSNPQNHQSPFLLP